MGGGRDQEAATGAGGALGADEGAETGSMLCKLTGGHIPNEPLPAGRLLPLVLVALLAPAWSPDGRCLLFQRYPLEKPNPRPGIWLLNVETGELQEVVTPGQWPTWLP